jgi:RNA polymerase sigma-70 factor (ECF subfamily)
LKPAVTHKKIVKGKMLKKTQNAYIGYPVEFVQNNIGWMLAVATRILRDADLAQDAVQLAFVQIFKNINKFEGRSKLRSWMHRITVNEALMLLRKVNRVKETSIDHLLPEFDHSGCRIDGTLISDQSSEISLNIKQTSDLVREKINELPERYRIVLILRDMEGYSTVEVAEMLGLTQTNTKMRLHRSRAALKKLLDPYMDGGLI